MDDGAGVSVKGRRTRSGDCHERALATGRDRMDNSCIPAKCYVPEPVVANLMVQDRVLADYADR